jgi:hypothetical protein
MIKRFTDDVLRELGPTWHPYENVEEVEVVEINGSPDENRTYLTLKLAGDWRTVVLAEDYPHFDVESAQVGMKGRIFTHGFGLPHHGIELGGTLLFYRSPLQEIDHRTEEKRKVEERRDKEFEEKRERLDERFAQLPVEFQKRIQMRRERNPRFRQEYEDYEMTACEGAVAVAAWATEVANECSPEMQQIREEVIALFTDPELQKGASYPNDWQPDNWVIPEDMRQAAVTWYWCLNSKAYDYAYKRQMELVPMMERLDSGNIFGMGMKLAQLYLAQPEDVWRLHGALAPLVGSEDYGDPIDLIEKEAAEA